MTEELQFQKDTPTYVTLEDLNDAINVINANFKNLRREEQEKLFTQTRDHLLQDFIDRIPEINRTKASTPLAKLLLQHTANDRTKDSIDDADAEFLEKLEISTDGELRRKILNWMYDVNHYHNNEHRRTPLYSRFKTFFAKYLEVLSTEQDENVNQFHEDVEHNLPEEDDNAIEFFHTARVINQEDIPDIEQDNDTPPTQRTRFADTNTEAIADQNQQPQTQVRSRIQFADTNTRIPNTGRTTHRPITQSHRDTPTHRTLPQAAQPNLVDYQIAAMSAEITRLTKIIGTFAAAQKPNKAVSLPNFTGKIDEVEPFISSVITAYAANDWDDNPNDTDLLPLNIHSTKEDLYAQSFAQVNKIALYFRGAAALWWQNLQDKPITLRHHEEIQAQTPQANRPGWFYIPPADGLIETIRKKFRSVTHISDANMKINRMHFDTRGTEDIRAFAAKLDALLIITGRHYDPDNIVVNGTRAEALFRTLPPWLEAKIREQGIPTACPHEQWCFGRVLERASLILAANKTRVNLRTSRPNYNHTSNRDATTTTSTSTTSTSTTHSKDQPIPKKKLSELTPKERADMIAQNICFFCRQKGHNMADCTAFKQVQSGKGNTYQPRKLNTIKESNADKSDYISVITDHTERINAWNNFANNQHTTESTFKYNEYGHRYPTEDERVERIQKYFKKTRCPCNMRWYSPSDQCNTCVYQLISKEEDEAKQKTSKKTRPDYITVINQIEPEELQVMKLHTDAKLPFRATPGSAGYDLYVLENTTIPAHKAKKVSTGIALACPPGTYGKLSPTSGLMTKGIVVMDGTIDEDYTGEIIICLENRTNQDYTLKKGTKAGQIIFIKYNNNLQVKEVDELKLTQRGTGGFGSTDNLNIIGPLDPIEINGKINNKDIKVLIDSGATGNLISTRIANETKIITTPTEAKNAILANGTPLTITKQALQLPITMGQYRDKIDFDVINTTHDMILGKKWLQQINPIIDWRTNTLTFKHKNKSITLKPDQENKTEIISAIQCAKDIKRKTPYYLCFLKNPEFNNSIQQIDPRVHDLLRKYEDVFPDELPEGLPPKRAVDHQI